MMDGPPGASAGPPEAAGGVRNDAGSPPYETSPERRASAELADRGREFARNFLSLRWVPLTAALLSLPLSAAAIFLSVQQPEVLLILPDQIRVVQGRQSGSAYVYLQPAFVSTGRNERIEVIRDMALTFVRDGADRVVFEWSQQLRACQ